MAFLHQDVRILARQPKNNTGQQKTVKALYKGRNDSRWGRLLTVCDPATKVLSTAKVRDVVLARDPQYPVTIRLHSGQELVCSVDMRLLTRYYGLKTVGELMVGESVACFCNKLTRYSMIESISIANKAETAYQIQLETSGLCLAANGIFVCTDD